MLRERLRAGLGGNLASPGARPVLPPFTPFKALGCPSQYLYSNRAEGPGRGMLFASQGRRRRDRGAYENRRRAAGEGVVRVCSILLKRGS